ncbi:MAG: hypothetical protein IJ730_04875 [Alphaproteobacteria bacterium]|nr:hypothetical protein [Alphaproteobacteria bacterium]
MFKILSVFVFIYFSMLESFCLNIIPFIHSFDPDDRGDQTIQYYIGNETDDFMAFMLSIHRRKQNIDGSDDLKKDEDSFIVAPSQIIIPPHTKRIVKVKWIGNKEYKDNPRIEQAYRLCIDQFPIEGQLKKVKNAKNNEQVILKMPKKEKKKKREIAQIKISYKVWTSLYAAPKDSRSDMVVVSSDSKSITIKNNGTRHGELKEIEKTVCEGMSLDQWLVNDDFEKVILAGSVRKFTKNPANSKANTDKKKATEGVNQKK